MERAGQEAENLNQMDALNLSLKSHGLNGISPYHRFAIELQNEAQLYVMAVTHQKHKPFLLGICDSKISMTIM